MERAVRELDVCVHLVTNRRCLVVTERPDGTLACVDADDRAFVCRPAERMSFRHPRFDRAVRRSRPTNARAEVMSV